MTDVVKGTSFRWMPKDQIALKEVKDKLTQGHVLAFPYFDKVFKVECDAYGVRIGGVLVHKGRPLVFSSEKLCDSKCKYPTYDEEFHTIVQCLKYWSHYLMANEFILHSDQAALEHI